MYRYHFYCMLIILNQISDCTPFYASIFVFCLQNVSLHLVIALRLQHQVHGRIRAVVWAKMEKLNYVKLDSRFIQC